MPDNTLTYIFLCSVGLHFSEMILGSKNAEFPPISGGLTHVYGQDKVVLPQKRKYIFS